MSMLNFYHFYNFYNLPTVVYISLSIYLSVCMIVCLLVLIIFGFEEKKIHWFNSKQVDSIIYMICTRILLQTHLSKGGQQQ